MSVNKSTLVPGSEEEARILSLLKQMEENKAYSTKPRYAANADKYPDNTISFSKQHIEHLRKFPNIDPEQYISNLKLMNRS